MQHVMMSFYQHTENGSAFRDLEKNKVECVYSMVVVSILPDAEFGPNDHWEDPTLLLTLKVFLVFFRLNLSYVVIKMCFDISVIKKFPFFVKIKKMLNPCSG